ncbi:hypothetical protein GGR57DRAFT_503669 [Xylariaceae sp. FL1272]|nr:hypothetical protein GGR57DRAFT_503669 [Xylariaceae sp. FL1272]
MPTTRWDEHTRTALVNEVLNHAELLPAPNHPFGRIKRWEPIHQALVNQGIEASSNAIQAQWVQVHRDLASKLATLTIPDGASPQMKLSIASGVPISREPSPDASHAAVDNGDDNSNSNTELPNISIEGNVATLSLHADRFSPDTTAMIEFYEGNLDKLDAAGLHEAHKELTPLIVAFHRAIAKRGASGVEA